MTIFIILNLSLILGYHINIHHQVRIWQLTTHLRWLRHQSLFATRILVILPLVYQLLVSCTISPTSTAESIPSLYQTLLLIMGIHA